MSIVLALLVAAITAAWVGFTFIVNECEPSTHTVRLWPYLVGGLGFALLIAII